MASPATILVVDDEAVVRRVLSDALSKEGYRVRNVSSAEDCLAALSAEQADLLLLDLQLGDVDGVEVMGTVRTRWPQTEIIILTAHGSMMSAIAAVRHGAADYLLKPVGVDALRARVAEVLARQRAVRERQEGIRHMYQQLQALVAAEGLAPQPPGPSLPPGQIYVAGPLTLDVQRHTARMDGRAIDLTPTEFAILLALAAQPGSVVPCAQIVRSFQSGVNDEEEARQVLRPHIVRLRRKLESDPSRPTYVQSVRGVGYRWGDGRDEEGGHGV